MARTFVSGRKDTRMKSKSRAPITGIGETRSELCQRCAGEVAQFPDLQCIIDPASTARKCFDCKKKNKSCDNVS
jgi:hypothetical protein